MRLGMHIEPETIQLGDFLEQSECVSSVLRIKLPTDLVWLHPRMDHLRHNPANQYTVLIALYVRITGARALMRQYREIAAIANKYDVTPEKVDAFVQRHLRLARKLDTMYDPCDRVIAMMRVSMTDSCGGPTQYREDRDLIETRVETVAWHPTPIQVLHSKRSDMRTAPEMLYKPVDKALARLSHLIRERKSDAELTRDFITLCDPELGPTGPTAVIGSYYPIRMTSAAECRAHSWYLACLVMINATWAQIDMYDDDDDDDDGEDGASEDDDDSDNAVWMDKAKSAKKMRMTAFISENSLIEPAEWYPGGFRHSLTIRHALHRCMGSYVPLFHRALTRGCISDADWRPDMDSSPGIFDVFFPIDTLCFHWGDLPSLASLLEDVGLNGVQIVSTRIPIVRMLMKSLPVCCQHRDLARTLMIECRRPSGEGLWRVIRSFFYCSLAGLYPGSERRTGMREMLSIYHMLYVDRNVFFAALEREAIDNKNRPAGYKKHYTCQLVKMVFREYFIYLASRGSQWVKVVNMHIDWEQFVIHTLKNVDYVRRCARLADSPKGDELLFARNALERGTSEIALAVYRFKGGTYVEELMEKFNGQQFDIQNKLSALTPLIRLMQRVVNQGIVHQSELDALYEVRYLLDGRLTDATQLAADPELRAEFIHLVNTMLEKDYEKYQTMTHQISDEVKANIVRYLRGTVPSARTDFDKLLDPRLGGVSREAVQIMYKTLVVYKTRSSPMSIRNHLKNLSGNDLRVFAWYFNIISRLERFALVPLHADMVEAQTIAMRTKRFHLLPGEPLPPLAWTLYVCICCGRIATFMNGLTFGNDDMSYDINLGTMVCAKKLTRVAKIRANTAAAAKRAKREAMEDATALNATIEDAPNAEMDEDEDEDGRNNDDDDDEDEEDEEEEDDNTPIAPLESVIPLTGDEKIKQDEARKKKARAESRDANAVPCLGQPAIPIDICGHALEFGGERYLFCPNCGQLHTYHESGWGRGGGGYQCQGCRGKEAPLEKLERCAFCGNDDRGHALKTVEIVAVTSDPATTTTSAAENWNPDENPLQCLQTLHFCQKDANSIGLFAHHYTKRHYTHMSKETLWPIIAPANMTRQREQYLKYK